VDIDYDYLKQEAKERGVPVGDLMALSPSNDPFYAGTPGDVKLARWFRNLWQRFGYISGVHIRRMHYQIISQDPPVALPDGTPYENTERCWDKLNQAAKQARYLGMVKATAFVDRRNPPPTVYMAELPPDPTVGTMNALPDDFAALPDFPKPPTYYINDYDAKGRQRYMVEIWCEKSTMNDVLLPFCQEHGFNLVTGLGELSITAVVQAVERVRQIGKPTRIIYVSDFDPAGAGMPVSVARKIEYMLRDGDEYYMDIRLDPVVLTYEQVGRYRLPRTPIKESEKRAGRFEARYGTGAVELDALEALRPGELINILTRAIDEYYDSNLSYRIREARNEFGSDLMAVRATLLSERAEQIATLTARYAEARAAAEAILAPVVADLRAEWELIKQELDARALDPEEYPIPEANYAEEDDEQLLVSSRDYFEQLDYYKHHQGKASVA
jgi:hypothetical protein